MSSQVFLRQSFLYHCPIIIIRKIRKFTFIKSHMVTHESSNYGKFMYFNVKVKKNKLIFTKFEKRILMSKEILKST